VSIPSPNICSISSTSRSHWILGLACYALALAGGSGLGLYILLLGLEWWRPQPFLHPSLGIALNIGWLILFAIQHSGMARSGFSGWWQRRFYPPLERAVYGGISGALLLAMLVTWQPFPGEPLWRGPLWLSGVAVLGGTGVALVNLRFDHWGLFGLRQLREAGRDVRPDLLLVTGPYRYVRHPMMSCLLVFLWGHAVLTPTLALLSGGLSLYILLGLYFEERDLLRRFGTPYADYRKRVPLLIPWRLPAVAATYPPISETLPHDSAQSSSRRI